MKKTAAILVLFLSFSVFAPIISAEELVTGVKSAILIEPKTNTVLYELNADDKLPIASVTKTMTMLLIMERVDQGIISLDDMVTASKNAQSYGGSTMFLEAGEQFTVSDMLKGIAVASANDGCVAMAEFISGSTEEFVKLMNKRAEELGMVNTNFANCNGLDDDVNVVQYHSSARDVAIMSRELIKHKKIFDYTTIWTDSLRDGKFLLANTNKLIHNYSGATGLKTGSTTKAGCCLTATAERDGMELIAVVLGADNTNLRFSESQKLLDYGYANYKLKKMTEKGEPTGSVRVSWGVKNAVPAKAKKSYYVLQKKTDNNEYEKTVKMKNHIFAPVKKGDKLGEIIFSDGGETVKKVDIVASEDVSRKSFLGILLSLFGIVIE